jgi:Fe-S cluster biogenesis protein NfuA
MTDATLNQGSMEERAREVIEELRPAIQAHGGDIEFVGIDDGKVQVRLQGACVGCPHARMTLEMGVEQALRQRVPEMTGLVNLS